MNDRIDDYYSIRDRSTNRPMLLDASSAPGESGITVLRLRFPARVSYTAIMRRHFVGFRMQPRVRLDRAPAWLSSDGSVVSAFRIHPAGSECAARIDEPYDALIIAIDPNRLALAAAVHHSLGAQLNERLSGYDETLFDLARTLAQESADGYPNCPHYWNEIADSFVGGVVARHTSHSMGAPRGLLDKTILRRINDYILAHIDQPIGLAELAKIADRSPFHFSRVFSRSVGMSPHRYIVHLRLQRAIALIRDGQRGLAEIAATTGFSDQSHLSRWVRRVHGVSLRPLVRGRNQNSKNLHDRSSLPH
jgi:AraC family transcriptional regulator